MQYSASALYSMDKIGMHVRVQDDHALGKKEEHGQRQKKPRANEQQVKYRLTVLRCHKYDVLS